VASASGDFGLTRGASSSSSVTPAPRVLGRQAPGHQLLVAKVNEYRYLVRTLPPAELDRHDRIAQAASDALEFRVWGRFPRPRYDAAWAELHHLRNFLCHSLPLDQLLATVAEDVEADLEYLDPREARESRKHLDDVRGELERRITHDGDADGPDHVVRARLQALSKDTGDAHSAQWLRVNMMRKRLGLMGGMLMVVLPVAVWRLSAVLDERRSASFYLLIAVFGALGGLISGLLGRESLDDHVTEYYIRRRLLFLRPLIGASLAVVGYCAVRAGLFSVAGVREDSKPGAFLTLAFLAGFAERAFVKRIVDSTNSGGAPTRAGRRGVGD
jgi:hypothetical protein